MCLGKGRRRVRKRRRSLRSAQKTLICLGGKMEEYNYAGEGKGRRRHFAPSVLGGLSPIPTCIRTRHEHRSLKVHKNFIRLLLQRVQYSENPQVAAYQYIFPLLAGEEICVLAWWWGRRSLRRLRRGKDTEEE